MFDPLKTLQNNRSRWSSRHNRNDGDGDLENHHALLLPVREYLLVYDDKIKRLDVERGSELIIAQDYLKMWKQSGSLDSALIALLGSLQNLLCTA